MTKALLTKEDVKQFIYDSSLSVFSYSLVVGIQYLTLQNRIAVYLKYLL
jgi:hypothetical protein